MKRPPIGIEPEWLWKEYRLWNLLQAIGRYVEVDKDFPPEWFMELHELMTWKIQEDKKREQKKVNPWEE